MATTSPRSAKQHRLTRRTRRFTALAVSALTLVGTAGVAIGSSVDAGAVATDARTQRANVRAEQAKVAAQVDALEGSKAQVLAALNTLNENVRGQQATLSEARRQAETSAAVAAQAEKDAAQTTRELEALRARVAKYAVKAYVDPPGEELMRRFEAASAQEDATRNAFLNMQSRSDSDVIDQLRSTKARLEDELARAQACCGNPCRRGRGSAAVVVGSSVATTSIRSAGSSTPRRSPFRRGLLVSTRRVLWCSDCCRGSGARECSGWHSGRAAELGRRFDHDHDSTKFRWRDSCAASSTDDGQRHHRGLEYRERSPSDDGCRVGRRLQPWRLRLPRHQCADPVAPPELWHVGLRDLADARRFVFTTNGSTGPVVARTRPRHRLSVEWIVH